MRSATYYNALKNIFQTKLWLIVACLLIINFLVRIFIYYNTKLFYFTDYSTYLNGIEKIARGENQYLLIGNFLFAISYLGFFAKYVLGSLDFFFVFNCFLGTLSSLVIYILVIKITGMSLVGIITIIIHTSYTEFMVFSSVFYTPVLLIFLMSLFLLSVYLYLDSRNFFHSGIYLLLIILIFLLTFLFKPELKYLPWFLLMSGLYFLKKDRSFSKKILSLSFILLTTYYLLSYSDLITHPKGNVISNAFVFFGHTDYGGDGGEGAFIYPENKARYEVAFKDYCLANNISNPTVKNYNEFQSSEISKYITQHPFLWVKLQLTKFFRTFGVVPEGTSFKVLYTGLFKGHIWLTSVVVVTPVAIMIILFIFLFNYSAVLELTKGPKAQWLKGPKANPLKVMVNDKRETLVLHAANRTPHTARPINYFLYIYLLLFIYYLIATTFFGQYQERYRMPLVVVFIIPALGFFIALFNKEQFFKRSSLIIKGAVIVLFLTVWTFQAEKAIGNKQRLGNAIEKIEMQIGK